MNGTENTAPSRQAAVYGLAMVGFIALVSAGIWLAVYSTRYVPTVVGRIGGAAVYLGSVFTPAPEPTLSIVPTPLASSTISRSAADPLIPTSANPTTPKSSAATSVKPVPTTPGEKMTSTYPINGAAASVLSGLSDLVVTAHAVGYLTTASADSFVASTTVLLGSRPAVTFTIKNIGTNATGPWCFRASIPTFTNSLYESAPQQNLNPGDYIDYTLGFDQTYRGVDQMISITANIADTANTATCARIVTESNSDNNSASAKITILGN